MPTLDTLPATIDALIANTYPPDVTLHQVVQIVGETLAADRCFLYVRQPDRQRGRIAFCWCRNDSIPNVIQPDWQPEYWTADTTDLRQEDPLFRAAIEMRPSVYVADVETANANVLNRQFEQETFGHRALIHAHVQRDGQLWGILQPCLFGRPRHWTEAEKQAIETILPRLQPLIKKVVES